MQGSFDARSASEAQPEEGIAQRKLSGSRPAKPEGETADASRRHGQPGRQGQQPVKAGAAQPAEPKDDIRCESEVGCRPSRRRIVRRESEGRRWSAGSAEQPVRAGGSHPVEPKDTTPIRAGKLATGRAGVQAVDASRWICAGAARGRDNQRELGESATGGAGGTTPVVL